MTKRDGPKTQIKRALAAANREISGNARRGGPFAGGLAGEGWAGGYVYYLVVDYRARSQDNIWYF